MQNQKLHKYDIKTNFKENLIFNHKETRTVVVVQENGTNEIKHFKK